MYCKIENEKGRAKNFRKRKTSGKSGLMPQIDSYIWQDYTSFAPYIIVCLHIVVTESKYSVLLPSSASGIYSLVAKDMPTNIQSFRIFKTVNHVCIQVPSSIKDHKHKSSKRRCKEACSQALSTVKVL